MTRLRILPIFVLVIAVLLLAMGFMIVKPFEARVAAPAPTILQTQVPQVQPSVPRWIRIDPIGDKMEGDVFTVTSTTNLSEGEEVLVEVMNYEWHHPLCGSYDTVKVISGINGTNTISYTVNTSSFNPEKYLVHETSLRKYAENRTENETYFNLTPKNVQAVSVQLSAPPWIRIDPISDKQAGDVFTVTSKTNLPVGEEISLAIYDTYFHPGIHSPNETHYGCTADVTVIPGKDRTNITSYVVNSTAWRPWEYIVDETHDGTGTGSSISFNITPGKTL